MWTYEWQVQFWFVKHCITIFAIIAIDYFTDEKGKKAGKCRAEAETVAAVSESELEEIIPQPIQKRQRVIASDHRNIDIRPRSQLQSR